MNFLPVLVAAFAHMQSPVSHSVLFDTDQVKVIKVNQKPGPAGRMHKHDVNRVMIYLDAGEQRLVFKDEGPKDVKVKPGEVRWDPAGGLHTSQIMGTKAFRLVEIELKKPKGSPVQFPALDPVKVDSKHYKVEFENDQVRVVRAKFDPGYKTPMHEHVLPRVVVFLTETQLKVTAADGKVTEPKAAAGDVIMSGNAKHEELNASGKPFEVLVVELKTK
jgi:quercetin dioxygenase-like cupin family protein